MGVRMGPGKGVFEQDSQLVGGVWVKRGNPEAQKYSTITFLKILPSHSHLKSFPCRKDETGFTGKQEFQWWALVKGSAQIKFVS